MAVVIVIVVMAVVIVVIIIVVIIVIVVMDVIVVIVIIVVVIVIVVVVLPVKKSTFRIVYFSRTVAIDMRGYGDSEKPSGVEHYAMDHLVNDVKQVVDALGSYKNP